MEKIFEILRAIEAWYKKRGIEATATIEFFDDSSGFVHVETNYEDTVPIFNFDSIDAVEEGYDYWMSERTAP